MKKCKNTADHDWTIYFCNKMSTELPAHEAPLINIPLDQPQNFCVCHKCGTVNYTYKGRVYLAKHSESYV